MRPILTDGVAWSVYRSVTLVGPAKTAEAIEMPFETWTQVSPGKHVLDRGAPGEYGHIVLDGDPAPPSPKGHSPPIFGPCLLWSNGRPSQLLLRTCSDVH